MQAVCTGSEFIGNNRDNAGMKLLNYSIKFEIEHGTIILELEPTGKTVKYRFLGGHGFYHNHPIPVEKKDGVWQPSEKTLKYAMRSCQSWDFTECDYLTFFLACGYLKGLAEASPIFRDH